jgi:hypothetical protein
MCKSANAAITARHKEHYAEKIDVSQGAAMPWKKALKLLFGPAESIVESLGDIRTFGQNLQNFFIDKVTKISLDIANLLHLSSKDPHVSVCPQLRNQLNTFQPVTEEFVKKIILDSPPKTSRADCVPTWFLIKHLETLIAPITRLFNMSLASGVFPDIFKTALITPLLKKAGLDKNNYANYRPISNLVFLGKVLERIVHYQLRLHLDNEPALNPLQSSYRHYHSTETALTKITNDILLDMDHKRVTLLALLDFSAAFDTIDHNILIDRLAINFNINSTAQN